MAAAIPRDYLRRLRNEIPIAHLIEQRLALPSKRSDGTLRFLCPLCADFSTAIHPRINLARCFRCHRNFNPIDLVIQVERCSFLDAVAFLEPLLPAPKPSESRAS